MKQPNFLVCPIEPPTPHVSTEPVTSLAPKPSTPPKRRSWPWGWFVVGGLVAIFCLLTIPAAIALVGTAKEVRLTQDAVKIAVQEAQSLHLRSSQISLARALEHTTSAQQAFQRVGIWREVPYVGLQLRSMEEALRAGRSSLEAMGNVMDVFASAQEGISPDVDVLTDLEPTAQWQALSAEEKRRFLERVSSRLADLRLARDEAEQALEIWQRVPMNELAAPLRQALQPLAVQIQQVKEGLDAVVPLFDIGLRFAGVPDKMSFLVLLQNADELRPAGGFIGTIGRVTADGGELPSFDFADVYQLDRLVEGVWKDVPPTPIRDQLGVRAWYLRDSNWSPDFSVSASRILDVFERERTLARVPGDTPQAVVAFEPAFFEELLRIVGPIKVEGKTFESKGFFDQLQYEVEQGFLRDGISVEKRKEIVSKLGEALRDKLLQLPLSRWPEVLKAMQTSLARKQILLYATDPALQRSLDRLAWTGRAAPTRGDFVWVVDANLAALKTDGVMDKRVTYAVDAHDPDRPTATVTLTYQNLAKQVTWRYTRYRSYTRIYVPEGSTFVEASGYAKGSNVDVTHELGKTVYGAFWTIEPGATRKLVFTYQLPTSVADDIRQGTYRLDWPKQIGADHTQLTVDLRFATTVVSASPPEYSDQWGDKRYQVDANTLEDRTFEVKLKK